jgi:hypothetical protein
VPFLYVYVCSVFMWFANVKGNFSFIERSVASAEFATGLQIFIGYVQLHMH